MARDPLSGGEAVITVWLSLSQMAELFGREKSVLSRHLRNVSASRELSRKRVVAEDAATTADGKTHEVEHFGPDAALSVGIRVNPKRGTQFRIWATRLLRGHLLSGCTLNERRLRSSPRALPRAIAAAGLLAFAFCGSDASSPGTAAATPTPAAT